MWKKIELKITSKTKQPYLGETWKLGQIAFSQINYNRRFLSPAEHSMRFFPFPIANVKSPWKIDEPIKLFIDDGNPRKRFNYSKV